MKRLAFATLLLLPLAATAEAASSMSSDRAAPAPPAWASSLPADESLSDAQRDAIHDEARDLVMRSPASATRALLAELSGANARCGRAHAAAISGALAGGVAPADIATMLETMKTRCNEVIVEATGAAPNPDGHVAVALLRRTSDPSAEPVRRAAWLAYGSIGATARARGDSELAGSVDATLASAVATASGDEHVLMVHAAANAGCISCVIGREEGLVRR